MISGNLKVEFKNLAIQTLFLPHFDQILSDWILGDETRFLDFEAHRICHLSKYL